MAGGQKADGELAGGYGSGRSFEFCADAVAEDGWFGGGCMHAHIQRVGVLNGQPSGVGTDAHPFLAAAPPVHVDGPRGPKLHGGRVPPEPTGGTF